MPSVQIGDNIVSFYNWAGYMDNRSCDFLAAAASTGQIITAFSSSNPLSPGPGLGYNVLSKLNIIQSYLLDSSQPISLRLDAADQTVNYLASCKISATSRKQYFQENPDLKDYCSWSNNYFLESKNAAMQASNLILSIWGSYVAIRNNLQANQDGEITEAQLQTALNQDIADLNEQIAKTQGEQDRARVIGFFKDVIIYVIPVVVVAIIFYLWKNKKR